MFNLLLTSLLSVFLHFASGTLVLKFLNISLKKTFYFYSLTSLLGIIFLSFIALLANFFFKLDILFNTLIFLIIIIIFFIFQRNFIKNINKNLDFLYFLIICSFGVSLFLVFSNSYRPDAGLYHLPYINILNENKIIIGASNLHQRFGHISILQYLSGIHFNYFFKINGIVLPAACIATYTIFNLISNMQNIKIISVSKFFSILILIYVCFKMNRYSEYGNDAVGHFIFFVVLSLYLNFKENINNLKKVEVFYLIYIFSIFVFLNKTFLIASLLIPLLLIKDSFFKFLNMKTLIISIFIIMWFSKNILSSGCLIYPMPITCFNFEWTNFIYESNILDVSVGSEAWAKDWSNQNDKILGYKDYLKNFYWIKFWIKNQFLEILEILIPYLLMIMLLIIYLKLSDPKNKIVRNNQVLFKNYIFILSIIFIGILIWFLKGPIYRYGYSYIISFIALIISLLVKKYFYRYDKKKLINLTNFLIFLAVFTLVSKQGIRISNNYNKMYYNYPWPKFYSFEKNNKKIILEKFEENNKILFFRPKNTYCFYSKSPCTSVGVDKNLKMKIKHGYRIYYF